MKKTEVDILVTGGYGGNLGDDCLMATIWYFFASKGISDVAFLISNKNRARGILPPGALCFDNHERFTLSVNHLVYGGGTLYFDFGVRPANDTLKYINYVLHPQRFIDAVKNKIYKRTIIPREIYYLAVGLGPFVDGSRVLSSAVEKLGKARYISFRDEKSAYYYPSYNMIGEDICFSTQFRNYLPPVIDPSVKNNLIGVVVRDWPAGNSNLYIDEIKRLIESGKYKDYQFEFFAFSKISDEAVYRQLRKDGHIINVWDNGKDTIHSYLAKMSRCKVIVSARFHGLVFSSLLNIPFVGVGIDEKLDLLCDKFVTNDCPISPVVDNSTGMELMLAHRLDHILENYDLCTDNIRTVVSTLRERSDLTLENFFKEIKND